MIVVLVVAAPLLLALFALQREKRDSVILRTDDESALE